jgi:peptide/nickel transport system ATP-binding protein
MTGLDAHSRGGRPLIEVRGLRVDYGLGPDAVHAVIDADLTLAAGAVLGLAGESGSGKSTLAYAAIRLLRMPGMITGGQVLYHPAPGEVRDLLAMDEPQLRSLRWSQIAVVLQSAMNALNPVLSIGAQLTDVLQAHEPGMDAPARQRRAAELLGMVGITPDRLSSYPHELSGGMRQRVMIAMAIVNRPKLLIADEPTTALDVTIQAQILELLAELRAKFGLTMLFISHDLAVVSQVADRVAVMYAGNLVELGSKRDIFQAAAHPYTRGLLNAVPTLRTERGKALETIEGTVPPLHLVPAGCPFEPRCGFRVKDCALALPALVELSHGHWARCPVVTAR